MITYKNKSYKFYGSVNDTIFKPQGFVTTTSVERDGFDKELYQHYISNRDFANAARYSSMFVYDDPERELEHKIAIRNIQQIGKRYNALYGNLQTGTNEAEALDFSFSVFDKAAFAKLDINNPYVEKFNKIYDNIGRNDDTSQVAKLSIKFAPHKSKFAFWDVENDNSYENFIKNTGYTTNGLRSKGIAVEEKDGGMLISFDKETDAARELLYNLGKFSTNTGYGNKEIEITGYDGQGKIVNSSDTFRYMNFADRGEDEGLAGLRSLAYLIDSANVTKDDVEHRTLERVYTTNTYGSVTGRAQTIRDMLDVAFDSDQRSTLKERLSGAEEMANRQFSSMSYADKEMYTNLDEDTETMIEADDDTRKRLREIIGEGLLHKGVVDFEFAESGGKFGCLVTIKPTDDTFSNNDNKVKKVTNVFIPGLFAEEAQKRAYQDTDYRALRELDDMEAWGYDYDFEDGTKIQVSREGEGDRETVFYLTDKKGNAIKQLKKSDIIPRISQDFIIRDLSDKIGMQFTNKDGNIINQNEMLEYIRRGTIIAANSLYPDGMEIKDTDDFLSIISTMPDKLDVKTYKKLSEAEKIYYRILHNIMRDE